MANIGDVAREAGVSKTTVSRVLNGTAPVNELTKKRIQSAMEKLDYSPSFLAQSMRSKKTKTIGVIIPDYANPFYSVLFKEIEKCLRNLGYMTLICPTGEDADMEIENVKKLLSRQIDGIIFFTYKGIKKHRNFFTDIVKQTPCVFMDQVTNDLKVSQVITDGYNGTKQAVEYLISKGHKRIGCIKGPTKYEVTNERINGYLSALEENDIPFNEELVFEGDFHIESGYRAGKYFSEMDDMPTAVLSVTDLMALGLIKYFQASHIKVPEQVEIIGFDNITLCTLVTPSLSTVAQPIERLGFEAVKLLVDKIEKPKSRNRKIVIPGELILRGSTNADYVETL